MESTTTAPLVLSHGSTGQLLVDASRSIAESLGVSPQAVSSTLVMVLVGLLALAVVVLLRSWRPAQSGRSSALFQVAFLIVCYSLCSSMLLILNKVAVTHMPAPSFLLFCQLATSSLFVKVLAGAGVVESEPLQWDKSKKFIVITVGFIGVLFSNITALRYVPVDTLICFRASTPLVIAVIEYLYLGRELPSAQSWASLLGVFVGVAVYTSADIHFTSLGYLWVATWYAFCVFEMVYVKKVVDSVQMTTWARAYYQNTLSILPMLGITLVSGEINTLLGASWGLGNVGLIALSCVAGLGMSYFSFALRAVISATSFSVIGNVCKVFTILVNLLMWDQHANAWGTCALLVCLAGGATYKQAPLRDVPVSPKGGHIGAHRGGGDRFAQQALAKAEANPLVGTHKTVNLA